MCFWGPIVIRQQLESRSQKTAQPKSPDHIVQQLSAPAEMLAVDAVQLQGIPLRQQQQTILQMQRMHGNQHVGQVMRQFGAAQMAIQRDPDLATAAEAAAAGAAAGTAAAVNALADDEIVLTSNATYATDGHLTWFRDQVKPKFEGWGLAFSADSVQLRTKEIGGTPTTVVALKWDAAWGAKPTTPEIPFSMEPIDARAAVAGVKTLDGWDDVAAEDQTILTNMLSGETNQLSAAARNRLRGMFSDLSSKSEADQAQALTGIISAKESLPSVVAEPVTTAKVAFEMEGPTEKKDYAFSGKVADAEEWKVKFEDAVTVPIVAPKAPEPGFHNHTVAQAADAASYLPKANRAVMTRITLNAVVNPDDAYWAGEYNQPGFHSYMTAGAAGNITIYPNAVADAMPDDNYMRGTMVHETGHTWSYQTWGQDTTKGKWLEWKAAMDKDKVPVSGYATASIDEDVAETIQIYVTTQGSPRHAEYRNIVPNRFAMLDSEYK